MEKLTYTSAFSGYSVDNIGKAKEFYGTVLGLNVEQTPEGLKLSLAGTTVFIYGKPNHQPATFTVLNFEVEDIDAAVEQLKNAGVTLENYDGTTPMKADEKGIYRGKAAGYGPDIAWFKDPAGNILSVVSGK